ncbi:type II toxin-antitoxin system HipA family toxin [Hahella ganghwensis]|uniref:type II toxin-antitoxin system HipA family toxin n=1 Tax=Hahella ganghwensis TaxID=286420 RepID=UPI000362B7E0|nr:type II toxin-antitoxin system HipA family toxin [Hahella ganghwensis]
MNREVYVYADWEGLDTPTLVGTLRSTSTRTKEHFSFSYDAAWLTSPNAQQIDPDLHLYTGEQHSLDANNFRVFLDSCPDRWGRLLMKRREAILARQEERQSRVLLEVDYLLGVHDLYRQGALRFKTALDGEFLDNDERLAAPPMSSLKELEYAAQQVEVSNSDDPEYVKWLYMLMSPGSSLGGARPKASVVDDEDHLWIAKFPSQHDDVDIAAWEYLTYQLALKAGVQMAPCRIDKFNSHHHTFLTRRFDRTVAGRRHFTSALTQLGYYDGDYEASYLELAQFLTDQGANTKQDLAQLWRRIVFNIAVSNTDDHLRNHGFIYHDGGWILSPAYDINPVTPANGLHLNISDNDNRLDYNLAMDVIDFFQLQKAQAEKINEEVLASVRQWKSVAATIGISRGEQNIMAPAFRV